MENSPLPLLMAAAAIPPSDLPKGRAEMIHQLRRISLNSHQRRPQSSRRAFCGDGHRFQVRGKLLPFLIIQNGNLSGFTELPQVGIERDKGSLYSVPGGIDSNPGQSRLLPQSGCLHTKTANTNKGPRPLIWSHLIWYHFGRYIWPDRKIQSHAAALRD